MKAGVPPRTILEALGAAPAPDDLARAYNPGQPRVPAGNGIVSGRWTSGDYAGDADSQDEASSREALNAPSTGESGGVQIADAASNWAQYLNPIGTAEAAESGGTPFNGVGPNAQHHAGVEQAMADYQAHGFAIYSNHATAVTIPGFATPRIYDFIAFDPIKNEYIGVEVKTTMYDTIFFDPSQVEKDVAIYEVGPGVAPALRIRVTKVAYEAYCTLCSAVNLRYASLALTLFEAGIRVSTYRFPGGDEFQ